MLASRTQGGGLLSGMSFFLPLGDSGSGAVNTTPVSAAGSPTATFTRATTATTVGPTGLVVSVGSGVARSYYDPTTLSYLGYLAEGARTNLCLQSEDLSTTWTTGGGSATVSTNVAVAPDGNTTADKVVPAAASALHFVTQNITKAASSLAYTAQIWAKPSGYNFLGLVLDDAASNGAKVCFDVSGGSISFAAATNGAGTTVTGATIKAYPSGWYQCTLSMTSNTATIFRILASAQNASGDPYTTTFTGDGASGVLMWGAQLEQASFASSYIPTTTIAVTRNADVLTYASSGNVLATAGTSYAEIQILGISTTQVAIGLNNLGSGGEALYFSTATNAIMNDGTNTNTKTGLSDITTAVRKRSSSWGTGQSITGDGASTGTATFDGDMSIAASFGIGSQTNGGNNLFGTIRNVRIWTIQLADSQLQGITT